MNSKNFKNILAVNLLLYVYLVSATESTLVFQEQYENCWVSESVVDSTNERLLSLDCTSDGQLGYNEGQARLQLKTFSGDELEFVHLVVEFTPRKKIREQSTGILTRWRFDERELHEQLLDFSENSNGSMAVYLYKEERENFLTLMSQSDQVVFDLGGDATGKVLLNGSSAAVKKFKERWISLTANQSEMLKPNTTKTFGLCNVNDVSNEDATLVGLTCLDPDNIESSVFVSASISHGITSSQVVFRAKATYDMSLKVDDQVTTVWQFDEGELHTDEFNLIAGSAFSIDWDEQAGVAFLNEMSNSDTLMFKFGQQITVHMPLHGASDATQYFKELWEIRLREDLDERTQKDPDVTYAKTYGNCQVVERVNDSEEIRVFYLVCSPWRDKKTSVFRAEIMLYAVFSDGNLRFRVQLVSREPLDSKSDTVSTTFWFDDGEPTKRLWNLVVNKHVVRGDLSPEENTWFLTKLRESSKLYFEYDEQTQDQVSLDGSKDAVEDLVNRMSTFLDNISPDEDVTF